MGFKALTNLFGLKKPKVETTVEYQKWRDMIIAVEPEQVDVSKSDTDRVYWVIMDIGMIEGYILGCAKGWFLDCSALYGTAALTSSNTIRYVLSSSSGGIHHVITLAFWITGLSVSFCKRSVGGIASFTGCCWSISQRWSGSE